MAVSVPTRLETMAPTSSTTTIRVYQVSQGNRWFSQCGTVPDAGGAGRGAGPGENRPDRADSRSECRDNGRIGPDQNPSPYRKQIPPMATTAASSVSGPPNRRKSAYRYPPGPMTMRLV